MPERRAALVDAGVELVLQQCFQDLLASVDTRSITGAAGVTTGSFFHHFRNRAEFTDAVLERFVELWQRSAQRTLGIVEAMVDEPEPNVRNAAASEWSGMTEDEALTGLLHLLWVSRHQPVSEHSERTAGDVLAEQNAFLDRTMVSGYEAGLRAIRREMVPPFTVQELSIAVTALSNGMEMRRLVDPAVREDLFADLVTSMVGTITRPASERAEEAEVAFEAPLVARPTSGVREAPRDTWRQIADAAAPLFVERRVADVKIAEIAAVAGVSASTVYHQFGRVSAVAAAGWAQHLPELEAIATEPLTAREGPVLRMEQVLGCFIRLARESRGALEGLVLETVAGTAGQPASAEVPTPLSSLLVPLIRELRARGVLRRRIDSEGLARSTMQLTAMRLLASPDDPEERIIDDTLGLVLEGALARTDR